jgi:hypothetical protein
MTYYFCIAEGMADCTPNTQDFYAVETRSEFEHTVKAACEFWEAALPEADETRGDEFYAYEFRLPREGEDNYSQRLRIAASDDFVLDIIGMTESDYQREMGGIEDRANEGGEF